VEQSEQLAGIWHSAANINLKEINAAPPTSTLSKLCARSNSGSSRIFQIDILLTETLVSPWTRFALAARPPASHLASLATCAILCEWEGKREGC